MAQVGYTPISLYYSATASAAPSAGNLANGELALNITDGRLYYKDNGGVVQVLASKAGASGDVVGPASATDNALVRFDATTGKLVQNSVGVLDDSGNLTGIAALTTSGALTLNGGTANGVAYLDGSKVLTTGSALTFDGTNLGIGTSSPGTKLHVSGSANYVGGIESSNTFALLGFKASGSGGTMADPNVAIGATGDALYMRAGGAERMRIDAFGNLGLGVTPSAWSGVGAALQVGASAAIIGNSAGSASLLMNAYYNGSAYTYINTAAASRLSMTSGAFNFFTAPSGTAGNAISFTQAMTLDSSGNLLVGTTNSAVNVGVGAKIIPSGSFWAVGATGDYFSAYNSSAGAFRFYVSTAGNISATNTTISAISDKRLKENIQDLDVGLDKIMALRPRKFDWKPGKGKDIKGDRGWIAQEFEQVFPDMIDEWKDPAPEGEEPYKSVRADLIPVLVKAIQEQQAIIESLKADVAALKAAA